ncbi:hypothetical protein SH668x_003513 [Planctomicrobium sp. SH668]|uniref:hypothetical protein n=1 Tax=Planctomicrobium sp. SH668 TaxID=3448126 RepID=UPI003F5C3D0F
MNIKKLAAEHIEKGVFGLFALIVLGAIATANWSAYEGTPRQIREKVASGKKALAANTWPEEEKEKFSIAKEDAPANLVYERLRKEYSPGDVESNGKLVSSPWGGNEPVREPVLSAPQELIASQSRVFLHIYDPTLDLMDPMMNGVAPDGTPLPLEEDDSHLPDDLRRKSDLSGGMGMGMDRSYGAMLGARPGMGSGGRPMSGTSRPTSGMMPSPSAGRPTAGGRSGQSSANSGRGNARSNTRGGSSRGASAEELLGMDGMMSGMDTMSMPEIKGEGHHFVSVRAVFPLREQITRYAEAINKSFNYAAMFFDIRDFQLERQTAQPGSDPWSGPWEPVDMKVAEDILNKVDGFDAEVVNPMITNAVITMPLPARISGVWNRQATHPKIEKFTLSPEDAALETEMQQKLLNEVVKQQKEMDSAVVKRGGFAKNVIDSRQLNQDMFGGGMYQTGGGMGGMGMSGMSMPSASGMSGTSTRPGANRNPRQPGGQTDVMQALINDMAKGATNESEEKERIRKWIESRVRAEGELLLFRYLDFNVEPGKTYRYRVRFELANPNYGKRIAEAGGESHVVEGETRLTPWSDITTPVTVDQDVKYFLTDVREQNSRVLPTASFDVFEWAQKYGTFVNAMLEIRFGQQLVQEVMTNVIDPAKFKNEKAKYEFKSTDYLVDTLEPIRLEESFHEKGSGMNIKLPVGSMGRITTAPKVLISSANRQLSAINPVMNSAEYSQQKSYMKAQAELYEDLKEETLEDGSDQTTMDLLGEGRGSARSGSSRSGSARNQGPRNAMQMRGSSGMAPGRSGSSSSRGSSGTSGTSGGMRPGSR